MPIMRVHSLKLQSKHDFACCDFGRFGTSMTVGCQAALGNLSRATESAANHPGEVPASIASRTRTRTVVAPTIAETIGVRTAWENAGAAVDDSPRCQAPGASSPEHRRIHAGTRGPSRFSTESAGS